jgi:putative transposase
MVSFGVELPDPAPLPRAVPGTGGRVVGVDLGITALATLSSGEVVANSRRLSAGLTGLRRAQRVCARRRGPDRRTRVGPSNRWRKARSRADKIHTRVANLRRDDTHRFTTRLVRRFGTIVIEDLHVAGMLRNRRLARHIADANWAQLRRQLAYKTQRAGVRLVVADRWFASSKTCSGCGTATTKLTLSERTYQCVACGVAPHLVRPRPGAGRSAHDHGEVAGASGQVTDHRVAGQLAGDQQAAGGLRVGQ